MLGQYFGLRSKSHPTAGIALVKIAATHSARRATPVPGNFGTAPFLASLAEQNSIETEATAQRVMTPMAMFDIYM